MMLKSLELLLTHVVYNRGIYSILLYLEIVIDLNVVLVTTSCLEQDKVIVSERESSRIGRIIEYPPLSDIIIFKLQ